MKLYWSALNNMPEYQNDIYSFHPTARKKKKRDLSPREDNHFESPVERVRRSVSNNQGYDNFDRCAFKMLSAFST